MSNETHAPADWDMVSFCTVDGCRRPASHGVLVGMVDDTPVYEMTCCEHAATAAVRS